jgi:hypothetical protein
MVYGKAILLEAWKGPEGSRRMRLLDFETMAHEGRKVVSPTHRPPLSPRKYSCYSYLLGYAIAHLVETLRYKPEGREFDSPWCLWNFSLA